MKVKWPAGLPIGQQQSVSSSASEERNECLLVNFLQRRRGSFGSTFFYDFNKSDIRWRTKEKGEDGEKPCIAFISGGKCHTDKTELF